MVGSGTRNARAISSVVSPPSRRRVSATRASVDSTGWQATRTSREQVVPDVLVDRASRGRAASAAALTESAELLVLALEHLAAGGAGRWRGSSPSPSATRPGCRGCPSPGQRSSAVTSASCARSSARPTSRTMRTRPPMSRADSIRQTASMAVRVATRSGRPARPADFRASPGLEVRASSSSWALISGSAGAEVLGLEDRADLDLRLLARHRVGAAARPTRPPRPSTSPARSRSPAMSSLVSAKGPSMTVFLPPAEAHALALAARMEPVAGQHDARPSPAPR